MKAIKITTGNEVSVFDVLQPAYKALQKEVGGYIEIVRPKGLPHPFCLVIDEEGLLNKKPINKYGSFLYGYQEHGQPIVGDIVIMKEVETEEGRDLGGLSDDEIRELHALLMEVA